MEPHLLDAARRAKGFMPEAEGLALYDAAVTAPAGPLLEIGSYCGKSAIYLGAAARAKGTLVYSIDHHRGSEEHQPGEGYHDPQLVDDRGRLDTLGAFRRTIVDTGLEDVVVGVIGDSATIATHWSTPLALAFLDGSHSAAAAKADYEGWAPHVRVGGLLVLHDVFENPEEGGRPPFEIYRRALDSRAFDERTATGSLRVLERVGEGF